MRHVGDGLKSKHGICLFLIPVALSINPKYICNEPAFWLWGQVWNCLCMVACWYSVSDFFWNRQDLEMFFSSNAQLCTVPHWREIESSQLLSSAFASVFFFSFVYPEMLLLGAVMVVLIAWSDLELPGWQGSGHTSWGVCILQHDYEHLCWFSSLRRKDRC